MTTEKALPALLRYCLFAGAVSFVAVYLFIAVVFFVLSYTLSQASYRLEKELGIGER